MTSRHGNIFRITGPLWWESMGLCWIPLTKCLWCGALVLSLMTVWINPSLIRRHYNEIMDCRLLGINPLSEPLGTNFMEILIKAQWFSMKKTHLEMSYQVEIILCRTQCMNKQRVLMHGHQGWNVRHGLCHIYMRYVYIYELFIAFVSFVVCSLL